MFIFLFGFFDVIILFILSRIILHDRVETVESLHDAVHVDIELVSFVVLSVIRLRSSTKVACIFGI